jgi:3-hydroxyisobutyrate dehydrogenase-like beta-hydroxyacid dehydrogenase
VTYASSGPRVGVIGLGAMGGPMVQVLRAAELEVTVCSLASAETEAAGAAGARVVATPADVAGTADIVLTSLPGAAAVRQVVLGTAGIASAAPAGLIVVDTSTIAPSEARALDVELARRGIDFLDAPVSGGPSAAAAGTLSVMVGGEAATLHRARPVLEVIGELIVHCGPLGAGQVCKSCNQLVVIGTIELVAEALVLAERSGLDPGTVRRALLSGYAASRVLEVHGERMISRDFTPGGKAAFNLKDIETLDALAEAAGLGLPAYAASAVQMRRLLDGGGGELDNSALVTVVEAGAPG